MLLRVQSFYPMMLAESYRSIMFRQMNYHRCQIQHRPVSNRINRMFMLLFAHMQIILDTKFIY